MAGFMRKFPLAFHPQRHLVALGASADWHSGQVLVIQLAQVAFEVRPPK